LIWGSGAAWAQPGLDEHGAAVANARPLLTLGVFAYRPKPIMLQRFTALGDFLSASVPGYRFEVLALNGPELEQEIEAGRVDFVLTNPVHFHLLRDGGRLSGSLASMVMRHGQTPVHGIGGVIVRLPERTDLATLPDLRGRRIAVSGRESLGSYMAPAAELLQAGVPLHELHIVETGQPVDRVVEAVLLRQVDAGFVRTSVLEDLEREGKLQPGQLVHLNPQQVPGFALRLSTRLYPEWPFLAAVHVPPELSHQVALALMDLRPNDLAALQAGLYGFSIPADYAAVERVMRELRMPPFDQLPTVTWADVWLRYQLWIVALGLSGSLVLLLALGLGLNTQRLVRIKRELQADRALLQQQREALDRLAHYDPLTGVPNRRLLEDRMQVALARARRQASRLAVCYLDLDNFKPINDLLGHAAGDRFLIEITRRLQQGLRAADTLARLGGDEFVLLLADLSHEDEWQPVLQRLLEALQQPVQIDGHAVASSASVGVVLFPATPADPADPDTLLRHADQAMYQAKQEGRNRYRVFGLKT
jgi:diguanylate cyclase (GGDEF)-like protein